MESTALAHVAYVNRKPILIVRGLSDLAGVFHGDTGMAGRGVDMQDVEIVGCEVLAADATGHEDGPLFVVETMEDLRPKSVREDTWDEAVAPGDGHERASGGVDRDDGEHRVVPNRRRHEEAPVVQPGESPDLTRRAIRPRGVADVDARGLVRIQIQDMEHGQAVELAQKGDASAVRREGHTHHLGLAGELRHGQALDCAEDGCGECTQQGREQEEAAGYHGVRPG